MGVIQIRKKTRPPTPRAAEGPALTTSIMSYLDDDKAIEPVVLDLHGKTSIADAMIIATGTSQRHIAAMAQHLVQKLKASGHTAKVEGAKQSDWVLIDAGDVIVHLFRPETRQFYNLEKMWSVDLPGSGLEMAAAAS